MLIRLDRHCCDDGRVRQNRRSRWSFHGPWLNPTILTTKRKLLLLLLHGSWWNRCWRMNGRGGGSVRWFSTFRNVKVACVCLASSVVDAGKFFYIYVLAWAADSFNCQFGWHQCVVFKKDLFSGISMAVITPLNFNPFRISSNHSMFHTFFRTLLRKLGDGGFWVFARQPARPNFCSTNANGSKNKSGSRNKVDQK